MRGTRGGGLRVAGGGWSYGQGPFWGDLVGPNPTDRAKNGVKRSILVEADGGPLSVIVAGANVPDFKLLEATLDAIVVERPEPTEQVPQAVVPSSASSIPFEIVCKPSMPILT